MHDMLKAVSANELAASLGFVESRLSSIRTRRLASSLISQTGRPFSGIGIHPAGPGSLVRADIHPSAPLTGALPIQTRHPSGNSKNTRCLIKVPFEDELVGPLHYCIWLYRVLFALLLKLRKDAKATPALPLARSHSYAILLIPWTSRVHKKPRALNATLQLKMKLYKPR
jgi:hypothetical protein